MEQEETLEKLREMVSQVVHGKYVVGEASVWSARMALRHRGDQGEIQKHYEAGYLRGYLRGAARSVEELEALGDPP